MSSWRIGSISHFVETAVCPSMERPSRLPTIIGLGVLTYLTEYDEMVSIATGDDVTGYYIRNNDGSYTGATGTAVEGTTYYKKVLGVDIRGNVYGGGNNAAVTGNTNVNIGKRAE
jgi:hypothetical protein